MNQYFWQTDVLANCYADNVALSCAQTGRQLSYKELEAAIKLAQQSLAIDKKLLVLIKAKPSIDFVVYYLACLRIGHTAWLIDPETSQLVLDNWFERYQFDMVIDDGNLFWRKTSQPIDTPIADNLALLLSTSGSTGSAKLVKLSVENIASNCQAICTYLPIKGTAITTLPFHYSFGLSILHTHLASGAQLVLSASSIVTKDFWQLFELHQAHCFYGVPHQFAMLSRLGLARLKLHCLEYFAVAGGKLPEKYAEELAIWCHDNHKQLFIMYGQTEATARISYLPPNKALAKPNSIGQAIPNGKLWLLDNKGCLITEPKKKGQLYYQGKNVMLGYAQQRDDLVVTESSEQLATGDLAYFDDDGDFYITGREKRIAKAQGIRINLDEIEQYIVEQNSQIESVAVIELDEKLFVLLVWPGATELDSKALKSALGQFLKLHGSMLVVRLLTSLPRLSSGKVDYASITAQCLKGDCSD
ncbi:AMP-binding protein [Thalassotalea marina]|uniref:AMP-dependent synthetase/ligase domain-containing protein n=1 Tax=Thalassotalea marina TaxID=1673741 RepID=A0A919BB98_9GAMM|nr:AMP-binding protein [Thalassotalea marina]GHF80391.1 hypothetical protein GCM10017161_04590 [Thalassotalea marina]